MLACGGATLCRTELRVAVRYCVLYNNGLHVFQEEQRLSLTRCLEHVTHQVIRTLKHLKCLNGGHGATSADQVVEDFEA